jgi:pyridoxamine 5'-phosphate oxidase
MAGLSERDVDPDPLSQFGRWFEEARQAGVFEPEAVALATASADGAPSARMVLLKGYDERGYRFFTNYESRKGAELAENPRAALLFHWKELARQIRIEGDVERLTRAESAAYFASRAPESRLSALASPQSRVIDSREELERRVEEFRGAEDTAPAHWGGFLLVPRVYELWQRGEHRLHDRLRYRRSEAGEWVLDRLAP